MGSSTQWLEGGTLAPASSPCSHTLGFSPRYEPPGPREPLKAFSSSYILSGPYLDLKGHGKNSSSSLTGLQGS